MTIPRIHVNEAKKVEFLQILDNLETNWKLWLIRFWWNGVLWRGELEAGWPEPECCFSITIRDCEYEDSAFMEDRHGLPKM